METIFITVQDRNPFINLEIKIRDYYTPVYFFNVWKATLKPCLRHEYDSNLLTITIQAILSTLNNANN